MSSESRNKNTIKIKRKLWAQKIHKLQNASVVAYLL